MKKVSPKVCKKCLDNQNKYTNEELSDLVKYVFNSEFTICANCKYEMEHLILNGEKKEKVENKKSRLFLFKTDVNSYIDLSKIIEVQEVFVENDFNGYSKNAVVFIRFANIESPVRYCREFKHRREISFAGDKSEVAMIDGSFEAFPDDYKKSIGYVKMQIEVEKLLEAWKGWTEQK